MYSCRATVPVMGIQDPREGRPDDDADGMLQPYLVALLLGALLRQGVLDVEVLDDRRERLRQEGSCGAGGVLGMSLTGGLWYPRQTC